MKVPVHNASKSPMYIAGRMVAPGETRHFEENEVPHKYRPQAAAEVVDAPAGDAIDQLLAKPLAEILEAVKTMSKEEVNALGEREHAKGDAADKELIGRLSEVMLAKIQTEQEAEDLAREQAAAEARAKADAEAARLAEEEAKRLAGDAAAKHAALAELQGKPVKEIVPALAALSAEDLTTLEALEKAQGEYARKGVLEAISAEILKRAGGPE